MISQSQLIVKKNAQVPCTSGGMKSGLVESNRRIDCDLKKCIKTCFAAKSEFLKKIESVLIFSIQYGLNWSSLWNRKKHIIAMNIQAPVLVSVEPLSAWRVSWAIWTMAISLISRSWRMKLLQAWQVIIAFTLSLMNINCSWADDTGGMISIVGLAPLYWYIPLSCLYPFERYTL